MMYSRGRAVKDVQIFGVPEFVEDVNIAQVRLRCHADEVVAQSDRLSR